jgi:hypothetical protein
LTAVVLATHTLLRAADVLFLESLCHRMLGPLEGSGPVVGWAALVTAVAMPGLALLGIRRARRALIPLRPEAWLGERRWHRGHCVVVLPTDHPLALCLSGPSAQILVSRGLVAALQPEELNAVLGHEAVHLERRHHRYLLLATALDHALGVVPFVRPSTRALRVALERWADDEAVGTDHASRRALRRALLGVAAATVTTPAAAFTGADCVAERLDALDGEPPVSVALTRLTVGAPGVGVIALAAASVAAWATTGACF